MSPPCGGLTLSALRVTGRDHGQGLHGHVQGVSALHKHHVLAGRALQQDLLGDFLGQGAQQPRPKSWGSGSGRAGVLVSSPDDFPPGVEPQDGARASRVGQRREGREEGARLVSRSRTFSKSTTCSRSEKYRLSWSGLKVTVKSCAPPGPMMPFTGTTLNTLWPLWFCVPAGRGVMVPALRPTYRGPALLPPRTPGGP